MDASDQYLDCLCRTCLNEVDASSYGTNTRPQQWQFIFDRIEECGALRIAELLSLAVPQMEMLQSDELPKKICCKCLQELLSAYRFQQMCVRSEEQMREIVSTKESDVKISMKAASKECELGMNDTETGHYSSTHQILEQSSIQEPLHEITQQITEAKVAQANYLENINELLDACKDEKGRFNEFLKNEPPKDGGDRMHSTISVLSMEYEEERIHNERIEPEAAQSSAVDHLQSIEQLLDHRNDSQGEFCEFIKNEPIEDDERNIEYSDDDTIHSTISVAKEEVLAIESKEGQTNLMHDGDKPYECPYCPQRFRSKQSMIRHQQIHKDAKREACDIYGKNIRKRSLNKHKLLHTGEKPHKCDICEKSFIRIHQLRDHMRTHTGEKPFKCNYCELAFTAKTSLNFHLRSHLGNNVFKCEFCPLAFPLASERRLHLLSHKNEDPQTRERNMKALREEEAKLNPLVCEQKAQQSSAEDSQQQLQECIRRGENRLYECPYCSLRFGSKKSVSDHKRTHEQEACDICGKKIVKRYLNQHKQTHCGENLHKCDFCKKRFTSILALRNHRRRHTENPFKCKYCEVSFTAYTTMMRHLRTHLSGNIYRCEFCPLAFPLSSERRLHSHSHKNEDPETRERNIKALQEDEAKLRLQISKEKTQQLSTEESNEQCEKLFKCKYCEVTYKTSSMLVRHLRTHLGDNVYRCEFCPLAFPLLSVRRLHTLSHKNDDPETRERNIKALQEDEARLRLQISTEKTQQPSTEESNQQEYIRRGEKKAYECRYCPLRFGSKKSLRQHKQTHKAAKREACDICGKKIKRKKLSQHKLTHSEETLHKCAFCEKRFISIRRLRRHSRKHTGEKPFRCKYCELAYTRSGHLKKHLRTHLGDNIYRCKFCPLGFPLSSERRLHIISDKSEDAATRERNIKTLREDEAKLRLQIAKEKLSSRQQKANS